MTQIHNFKGKVFFNSDGLFTSQGRHGVNLSWQLAWQLTSVTSTDWTPIIKALRSWKRCKKHTLTWITQFWGHRSCTTNIRFIIIKKIFKSYAKRGKQECVRKETSMHVFWGKYRIQIMKRNKNTKQHDDVINWWKHFPRYWPFVRGIDRSPVHSPHKGQWRKT